MKNNIFHSLIIILCGTLSLIASCTNHDTPITPTQDLMFFNSIGCDQLLSHLSEFVQCVNTPSNSVLLQAQNSNQESVSLSSATITFDDTIYVKTHNQTIIVAPLVGTSVISINGITRIIQSGLQIALPIDTQFDNVIQINNFASEATSFDISISTNYLFQLERTVNLPQPLVTPLPTTNQNNIPNDNSEQDCVLPEGWTGFYTVERGDTLSGIAQGYEVTLTELQEANCIRNANILNPGDILRVPQEQIIVDVIFQTSVNPINAGACTELTWEAELASVVYLEGVPVARNGIQEVCPPATRTYTLLVVSPDGSQTGYTTTINVQSE